jgi:hypothetical protein
MKTFRGQHNWWQYKKMAQGTWTYMWIVIKQICNKIDNTSVNIDTSSTSCIKCLPSSKCNGIQRNK